MGWIDVELPGQVRGSAIKFLVEEVAPAADGLRKRQARGDQVQPGGKIQFLPADVNPHGQRAPKYRPRDTEASVADIDHGERMGQVVLCGKPSAIMDGGG